MCMSQTTPRSTTRTASTTPWSAWARPSPTIGSCRGSTAPRATRATPSTNGPRPRGRTGAAPRRSRRLKHSSRASGRSWKGASSWRTSTATSSRSSRPRDMCTRSMRRNRWRLLQFTTCSTGSRSAARAGKTARRRAPPARTNRVASGAPGVLPASLFPVFVIRRLSPLRSRPRRHRRASTPSTRFICTQGAGPRLRDRSDVSKHVGHSSVRQARLRRRVRQGRARDAGLVPPGELHRPRRAGAYIRPGDAVVGAAADFEGGPVPVPGGETAPGGANKTHAERGARGPTELAGSAAGPGRRRADARDLGPRRISAGCSSKAAQARGRGARAPQVCRPGEETYVIK